MPTITHPATRSEPATTGASTGRFTEGRSGRVCRRGQLAHTGNRRQCVRRRRTVDPSASRSYRARRSPPNSPGVSDVRLGFRNPPGPLRCRARPDHGRAGDPDLPDDVVRVPRHRPRRGALRPRGARQHLHPDHEPDPGRVRGPDHRARGWRRRARGRVGTGRPDDRVAQPRRERRAHRRQLVALRRHLQPAALHVPEAGSGGELRRRPRRSRRVARRDPAQHARLLRRDDRQPEGRHPRPRGHQRRRARATASRS